MSRLSTRGKGGRSCNEDTTQRLQSLFWRFSKNFQLMWKTSQNSQSGWISNTSLELAFVPELKASPLISGLSASTSDTRQPVNKQMPNKARSRGANPHSKPQFRWVKIFPCPLPATSSPKFWPHHPPCLILSRSNEFHTQLLSDSYNALSDSYDVSEPALISFQWGV